VLSLQSRSFGIVSYWLYSRPRFGLYLELRRNEMILRFHPAAAIACLLIGLAGGPQPPPDRTAEYQVKAEFLLNFTKFIEWPSNAFEAPDSPLTICILGDDPFGSRLDTLVPGEAVDGHKIAVRRLRSAPKAKACQMLFVATDEIAVPAKLAALGPGVLTVGDRNGFLRKGGMIAFVTEDRRVRFDVNLRATAAASLTVSARMLTVARLVQK
jgi:hypothetical protein